MPTTTTKPPRRRRAALKPDEERYSTKVSVKFTEEGRRALDEQREKDGYRGKYGASDYLRWLIGERRKKLGLKPFEF